MAIESIEIIMSIKTNINTLNEFLLGYKDLKRKKKNQDALIQLKSLPAFLEKYYQIQERIIRQNQDIAPDYNIFEIAKFETLETKLHSPFLKDLLDPDGTHSQRDLFLKSFFKDIPGLDESILKSWDFRYLNIINEFSAGGFGNIDIIIRYNNPANPFFIIIENKIYADDQELQIMRYYNYAKNILLLKDDQIKIIYLTLQGSAPTTFSMPEIEQTRLNKSGVLINISYVKHINLFLGNVIAEIKAPIVKYTVLQYLKTIKSITI